MVYVMSPAAHTHMSVIIVPASSIAWGILCIRSCRWSPLEPLLSCPDHISWYSFVKVMVFHNKGWNSDTARPEKAMHFVLLTLLFKARASREVL